MAKDLFQSLKSKLQTLKLPDENGRDPAGLSVKPSSGLRSGRSSWHSSAAPSRRDSSAIPGSPLGHQSDTPGTGSASRFTSPIPGASPRLSRAFSHASSQASKCSRIRKEYGLETGAWLWDYDAKTINFYRFSSPQFQLLRSPGSRTLKREAMKTMDTTRIHIKDSNPAASNRAIRRKGVITLHDVKTVALKEIQQNNSYSVPKKVCRTLVNLEESDKLLVSLIHYFQSYQRCVAAKRKFRFEQETKHVELLYDLLKDMASLDWTSVLPKSGQDFQANKDTKKTSSTITPLGIKNEVEQYENTKYLYPFDLESFQVLDELLEKCFFLLKVYKQSKEHEKDQSQESQYRVCKEKLNSLVKQRGEEKREFEGTLRELKPSLDASLRRASDDYRTLLSTGSLYSVATENLPKGTLKTNQYDSTFEFYVRFLALATWIALEREDYESIQKEADSLFGCTWSTHHQTSISGGSARMKAAKNESRPDMSKNEASFVEKLSNNVSRLYGIQLDDKATKNYRIVPQQVQPATTTSMNNTIGIIGQPCQFFTETLERIDP